MNKINFKKRWLSLIIPLFIIGLFFAWPLPNELTISVDQQPIKILDRNGKVLYEVRKSDFGTQDYLTFDQIPDNVVKILIAVEDRSFYRHPGISIKGIMRAAWQNYKADKIVSGGSTITQQLVRNRLQPKHRGYLYKIKEILLAIKLETRMSKKEILEAYLNSVYFGHQAYGVQAAAKMFFDKNVNELSFAESAFMIGLIQSPTTYNPFSNYKLAKQRQKIVSKALHDANTFSTEKIEEIKTEIIRLSSGKINIRAPHFVMWIMSRFHLQSESATTLSRFQTGGEIHTTLDFNLQSEAERIVENHLKKLEDKNVTSAAVVVLDAQTGELLTMVGSADYFDDEHDGAVNVAISPRQPGSALKPFNYVLALRDGYTAASTVADVETQFFTQEGNPYIPRNYNYGYHGLVRYREALANSYNISAIKVLERVGVEKLVIFLREAGITTLNQTPEHYGLALTLGDGEVKLLELTRAYGMLARGGKTLPLKIFRDEKITEGKIILDKQITWIITNILSDNQARLPEFGENSPLKFDFPVAAKTGTTRNSRDNWTIGYTPNRIVGVWVGNADNSPMRNTSGITGAGPIFHDVMLAATKNLPPQNFPKPDGIIQQKVCRLSGKLPTKHCPYTIREWFISGTEPRETDDIFTPIKIDTRTNQLANENCSSKYAEEKIFAIFPPELQKWAQENGWPQPPNQYSPLCPKYDSKNNQKEEWIIIRKPHVNESFLLDPLIPDENEKIIFEASASNNITQIDWFINDQKIGSAKSPNFRMEWMPEVGKFEVKAKGENLENKIRIEIIK